MDAVAIETVRAWLKTSPQVVRQKAPMTLDKSMDYVVLQGTTIAGYIDPGSVVRGKLRNGQDVMVVPLVSGGSGGVFYSLLYTVVSAKTRFAGYIPSHDGHLDVRLSGGRLEVRTPVYGPGDANCCPSKFHVEHDTLDGIRLVKLDAHDEAAKR
jgi:hypothetical protein